MLETHRPKIYKKCFSKMEVACLVPSAKTKKKKIFFFKPDTELCGIRPLYWKIKIKNKTWNYMEFFNPIQNSVVLECCIEKIKIKNKTRNYFS